MEDNISDEIIDLAKEVTERSLRRDFGDDYEKFIEICRDVDKRMYTGTISFEDGTRELIDRLIDEEIIENEQEYIDITDTYTDRPLNTLDDVIKYEKETAMELDMMATMMGIGIEELLDKMYL